MDRYQFVELDQKGTTWKHLSLGFDQFQLGEQLAKSIQEFEFRSRVLSSQPPPLTAAIEQWSHSQPSTLTIEPWSHSKPFTQATTQRHPSLASNVGTDVPTALERLSMPDDDPAFPVHTPDILELASYITTTQPVPHHHHPSHPSLGRVAKEHGQRKQVSTIYA